MDATPEFTHFRDRDEVVLRRDEQPLAHPRCGHPLRFYSLVVVCFCLCTSTQMMPASGQESLPARTSKSATPNTGVLDSGILDNGGTKVVVASELVGLLDGGGVPGSIVQLRKLEEQQRKVAAAAVACTVSVQIGPAQGCGVIITSGGYVLTAAHVAMRPAPKQRSLCPTVRGFLPRLWE